MSNFRLNLPAYLSSTFTQLTQDHQFDRKDFDTLKQAAASQKGSLIEESLETQSLNTLDAKLKAGGGNLHLDAVQVQTQGMSLGQAAFEVSLHDDAPALSSLASPKAAASSAEPSRAEQNWASTFETKLKTNAYTPAELERYKDICARFMASREGKPSPSAEELNWANGIQRLAIANKPISEDDMAKFRDISARQALHVRDMTARQPEPTAGPTLDDLRWAVDLNEKVQKGYMPSDSDQMRFQQMNRALEKFGPPPGFTPAMLQTAK